jgi:hypothetical protein
MSQKEKDYCKITASLENYFVKQNLQVKIDLDQLTVRYNGEF